MVGLLPEAWYRDFLAELPKERIPMSGLAESIRLRELKRLADRAVAHAERLHDHIESVWEAGGQPSAFTVEAFDRALRKAEILLLNYSIAYDTAEEPEHEA